MQLLVILVIERWRSKWSQSIHGGGVTTNAARHRCAGSASDVSNRRPPAFGRSSQPRPVGVSGAVWSKAKNLSRPTNAQSVGAPASPQVGQGPQATTGRGRVVTPGGSVRKASSSSRRLRAPAALGLRLVGGCVLRQVQLLRCHTKQPLLGADRVQFGGWRRSGCASLAHDEQRAPVHAHAARSPLQPLGEPAAMRLFEPGVP